MNITRKQKSFDGLENCSEGIQTNVIKNLLKHCRTVSMCGIGIPTQPCSHPNYLRKKWHSIQIVFVCPYWSQRPMLDVFLAHFPPQHLEARSLIDLVPTNWLICLTSKALKIFLNLLVQYHHINPRPMLKVYTTMSSFWMRALRNHTWDIMLVPQALSYPHTP